MRDNGSVAGKSSSMEHCKYCKKILFRKKNGMLACPNGCDEHHRRSAFNTVIDPAQDRRGERYTFDPWGNAR
jgi:uncharacterized Zn finger protein (UPF0148 family)